MLHDPEASDNDKYVALTFASQVEVACKGRSSVLSGYGHSHHPRRKRPTSVTGYCDEEALSKGVYKTYTEENLRYSQNAPLSMYEEVNTRVQPSGTNRHRSHRRYEYRFLCMTKGGGLPIRLICIRRQSHPSTRPPWCRS